jgi:hypothetical protein
MRLSGTILSMLRRFLLAALAVGAIGCQNTQWTGRRAEPSYYEVTTQDYRGEVIAVWISEGKVRHTEDGYWFIALERRVFHPDIVTRYPLGKPTLVTAANVVITRTDPPGWYQPAEEQSSPR